MRWAWLGVSSAAACAAVAAAPGCSSGEQANAGLNQPIQITGAPGVQFIRGPLPGKASVVDAGVLEAGDGLVGAGDGSVPEGGVVEAGAATLPPLEVTSVSLPTSYFISGLATSATSVSGSVADDAVAVGVALAGAGTGYWVIPTKGASATPGERDFLFGMSLNRTDLAGNNAIRVVGIGAEGQGGTQFDAPICIESRIPDNGHACNPRTPVPVAVFSLKWDAPFDLNLTVITPDGRNVNSKTDVLTASLDGGAQPFTPPGAIGLYDGPIGVIDRDSMANCVVDAWRQEDLVFQDYPPNGAYEIYADPFSACGQAAVRFTLTIYEPAPDGDLHATYSLSGELLGSEATGGVPPDGGSVAGLYMATKTFE